MATVRVWEVLRMTVITLGPVTFGSNMQYILQQQLQRGGQGESRYKGLQPQFIV